MQYTVNHGSTKNMHYKFNERDLIIDFTMDGISGH